MVDRTEVSGEDLLAFLRHRMSMSAIYQPVIIQKLIQDSGRSSRQDLADALVRNDTRVRQRAIRTLMRWPRKTLESHNLVAYLPRDKVFLLTVAFENEDQREEALQLCQERIASWRSATVARRLSKRYEAVLRAQGRCQACGALGALGGENVLDIDHIVPKDRANQRGKVRNSAGELIDVDDLGNLQVLCVACNRGKRAADDTDFRVDAARLADAVVQTARHARAGGLEDELASLLLKRGWDLHRVCALESGPK